LTSWTTLSFSMTPLHGVCEETNLSSKCWDAPVQEHCCRLPRYRNSTCIPTSGSSATLHWVVLFLRRKTSWIILCFVKLALFSKEMQIALVQGGGYGGGGAGQSQPVQVSWHLSPNRIPCFICLGYETVLLFFCMLTTWLSSFCRKHTQVWPFFSVSLRFILPVAHPWHWSYVCHFCFQPFYFAAHIQETCINVPGMHHACI